jgi:hypothetical protein
MRTTTMHALQWIVMALALLQGGWLTFDGSRALAVGDYFTPTSGPRAGELGPWAHFVAAVGLEPRSTFVKSVHVALGIAWLGALVTFAWQPATGWWAMFVCAAASLWYLPIGTVASLVVIGLLLTPQLRKLS